MDTLSVSQGNDAAFTVTLRGEDGSPYTLYTGSEPIAAAVWAGQDQAPLSGVATAAWLAASAGTITLSVAGSATTALEAATYRVKLSIAGVDVYEGALELGWSPGSAAEPRVYCTFADLKKLAPWIEKLRAKAEDEAGFLGQRADARAWFEDLLHRHYRGASGLSTDFYFVPGISFLGGFPGGCTTYFRPGTKSAQLQGWLDADRLDVTPQVVRACALYALHLVCEAQVSPGSEDKGWGGYAAKFGGQAENQAALITAELDTDGDGTNDTWIRLGVADTLEG